MAGEQDVQEIIELVDEVKAQQHYKEQFLSRVRQATTEAEREQILQGKPLQEYVEYYNRYLLELLNRIDRANQRIMAEFEELPTAPEQTVAPAGIQSPKKQQFYLSTRTRKRYLKEIGAHERTLKRILHPPTEKKKKKAFAEIEYTVYQPALYGRLANVFCENAARHFIKTYPKVFEHLAKTIRSADLRVLSQTYTSMMLFTTFLSLLVFFVGGIIITYLLGMPLVVALAAAVVAAVLLSLMTAGIFYVYPSAVAGSRNRMIKNDLPFVIIHMATVAGSGAKPLSMFKLIAGAGEYRGLEGEIKKILNYVNLFGYNISTALKTVAATTPSPRFRDLLNGMVATIESGGSLKSYLNSMAADAMHTYSLERKKYVQVLSTYSDIYTGILIAAPLLFIVTLAIINLLGGDIGGVSVKMIAIMGTYLAIPLLNIFFMLFLNIVQPEM